MRVVAWTLLFALPLLAGCLEDDAPPADDSETPVPVDGKPFELAFNQGGVVVGGGGTTTPANPDGCNVLGQDGVDQIEHTWTVPAENNGTPLRVLNLTATLTLSDPTLLDADMDVRGPGGQLLGTTTDFNVQTGSSEVFSVATGLTPGDYSFLVRGCSGRGAYHLGVVVQLQPFVALQAAPVPTTAPA